MPATLPQLRCALTTPFHPYLILNEVQAIGGMLSVALFRVLPRMVISHHPTLWSPDFPPLFLRKAATAWPTLRGRF